MGRALPVSPHRTDLACLRHTDGVDIIELSDRLADHLIQVVHVFLGGESLSISSEAILFEKLDFVATRNLDCLDFMRQYIVLLHKSSGVVHRSHPYV